MKWTLGQLAKIVKPILVDYELDVSSHLDKMDDVVAISMVEVKGSGFEASFDEYIFSLDISCTLTMLCAISLEEIQVPLNIHADEVFATENPDGDDVHIVSNEIDLDEVVLANIIMNIPMKVVKEDCTFESDEESTERINSAFADLDKYLK